MGGRRSLDPERLAWLRRHWPLGSVRETTGRFNLRFGERITVSQMRAANTNHKIGRAPRHACRLLDARERDWLRKNYALRPLRETRRLLAATFGKDLTTLQLRNQAVRLGLTGAPNTGRYPKGHVPANKGKSVTLPQACRATQFKPGTVPPNRLPLFSERWVAYHSGPILEIKIPEPHPQFGTPTRWIRKAVWVWRQHRGAVPPGHVVVQMDGDPANCAIGNLDCLPRGVLLMLNRWGGERGRGEVERARIRLAQLKWEMSRRRA